jgi:hypothetical protein
MDAWDTGLRD